MIAWWRQRRLRGAPAVVVWSVWWAACWTFAIGDSLGDTNAFGYVLFLGTPLTLLLAQGPGSVAGFLGGIGLFTTLLSAAGGQYWYLGVLAGLAIVALAVAAHLGAARLFARVRRAGGGAA